MTSKHSLLERTDSFASITISMVIRLWNSTSVLASKGASS